MDPLDEVANGAGDRQLAFVEELRELLGVAVHAEHELRQVVGSDREAVEVLG